MIFSTNLRIFGTPLLVFLCWAFVFSTFPAEANTPSDLFREEEIKWLSEHPVIRLGVGVAFPPFMWVETKDGRHAFNGMVSDYVDLLSKKLGVEMRIVYGIPFEEALARGRDGSIDFFPCISQTPERSEYLWFAKPYLSYPLAIVTREDAPLVGEVEDLDGKRLAVVEHLVVYSKLKNDYPNLRIDYLFTRKVEENLEAVSFGRADACIINLAAASYFIRKKGLTNLKVAASVDWEGGKLSMGVRKDWPVFQGIVQKALSSISQEEKDGISQKWIRAEYERGVDIGLIRRWSLGIGAGILLFFLLAFGWNRRLRRILGEKEKAEKALKENEEKLRNIVENSSNLFYSHTLNHEIVYVSPRCLEFFECDPEEAMVRWTEFATDNPINRRGFELTEEAIRTGRRQKPYELELAGKKGKRIVVEVREAPVLQDGKTVGIVGSLTDITDRKIAEEALRQSEERFRLAFVTSPDSINLNRASDGIYIDINDGFTNIMGYTREDAIGRTSVDLNVWKNPEDRKRLVEGLRSKGYVENMEAEFLCKDGTVRLGLMSARLLRIGDEDVILSITRDVTEKQRLRSQLEQAQKFEAIGTLAGGVAHDFNNLLMGIQGRASLAAFQLDASHPVREHIDAIENHVKSATHLTRQLLGFARGGKYEVKPVDVNEIVTASADMFGHTRKEIRIHVKTHETDLVVEADKRQIEQVLLNMFVNSWQAMPDGGELFLETSAVSFDKAVGDLPEIRPGHYAKISVSDTGVGMEAATCKRVFDPFFTTKEKSRGTGLGLASAYGIVKNHGGVITVYSEAGQGATFNIYLPLSAKKFPIGLCGNERIVIGSETILLVDDEKMLLEVGQAMLEALGYEVLAANDGQRAVEIVAETGDRIDLVVLDLIMPGMDGGRAFDRIRELRPGMPVILASGYSMNGKASNIMARGCNGFIQKPYSLTELSGKIRSVLG